MLKTFARICVLTLLSCGSAQGTEVPPLVLETLTTTSIFNPPPWVTGDTNIDAQSEIVCQQGRAENGNEFFRWHSVPKGESFNDWSSLYSVKAEHPLSGDLRLYANGVINRATQNCDGRATQFAQTEPNNTKLFIVFCPENRSRPGTGVVGFYNLTMAQGTLVENALQLRVPSFTLDDSFPPQTLAKLRAALRHVAGLKVVY